jgi:SecDF, P1 head subdomain
MRKVLVLFFAIAVCGSPALTLAAQPKIELRSVETKAGPGLSEVTLPGVSRPAFLGAVPVITNANIVYTQAITYKGEPAVGITLDKAADKRFCDFTSTSIGKPLGVLVDGKLVNVASIPHALCGGMFTITGKFSVEEAKRIASAFPDGPTDALKVFSVWQGTGEESSMQPYPMILFINHRWGEDFEGTTWYPLLGNGLIKVSGRIDANGVVALSEDEVISGEATEQRQGVVAGGKYTAKLEKNTLTGNGKYTDPKTKEGVTFKFSLKLAEQ